MAPLLLIALLYGSPEPGARLQTGEQMATYRIDLARVRKAFPDYANNGYSQRLVTRDGQPRLEVQVQLRPLASGMPARPVGALPPELGDLKRRLAAAYRGTLADQVLILFTWLRAQIAYRASAEDHTAVEDVLRDRAANCVGLANLALLVLERMGVEARAVTGLAFRAEDSTLRHLEGEALHRWIEIRYDDVGWVFADPAGKVNFVEATYVVLGVDQVHAVNRAIDQVHGGKVQLLQLRDRLRTVAHDPYADSRLRIRPNRLRRRD